MTVVARTGAAMAIFAMVGFWSHMLGNPLPNVANHNEKNLTALHLRAHNETVLLLENQRLRLEMEGMKKEQEESAAAMKKEQEESAAAKSKAEEEAAAAKKALHEAEKKAETEKQTSQEAAAKAIKEALATKKLLEEGVAAKAKVEELAAAAKKKAEAEKIIEETAATAVKPQTVQAKPLDASHPVDETQKENPKESTPAQAELAASSGGIGSSQFCTREEIRDGSWEKVQAMLPYKPVANQCGGYTKSPRSRKFSFGPHMVYDWQPKSSECNFQPFDRNQFCALFIEKHKQFNKTTTIGLSGDSLTFEHYSSLVMMMGLEHTTHHEHRKKVSYHRDVCNGALHIAWLRNDHLGDTYARFLAQAEPDIVVFNKGAHFQADGDYFRDLNRTVVDLLKWQRADPNRKLIWRTTAPGHPECYKFQKPINNLTQMEAHVENKTWYEDHGKAGYHWWEAKRQNQLVEEYLNQVEGLNFQMMDGYHLNILRPDQHRIPGNTKDCLHSCYPGKMDVYNQLLFNILQSWDTYDPRSSK